LDVGAGSIKIVQLDKENDKYKLVCLGEVKNPSGGNFDTETQMTKTAEVIKRLIGDLEIKTKLTVASMPETKLVSRVVAFPPIKESEIEKALFYEVETFVPFPKDKIQLDYQVIERTKEKVLVFVVAAQKEVVAQYEKLIRSLGLVPMALETTSVALSRALATDLAKPTMIVDLGSRNSTMVIVKRSHIYLTRVLRFGGDAFTRAISVSLGMDFLKAEEYKKTYGFQADRWENKIRNSLIEVFSHLAQEIKTGMLSFKEDWGEQVALIILSGGGATMPGLSDQLIKILGIEIQVGRPLSGIDVSSAKLLIETEKESSRFSVPVGLAKRAE